MSTQGSKKRCLPEVIGALVTSPGSKRRKKNSSAAVEIQSSKSGFLFPQLTSAQRDAIANPATGLVVYNTTSSALSVYDGSTWVNLSGYLALIGGTMAGAIAMGTNRITGLPTPGAGSDPATKIYTDTADALKLSLTGGVMSGAVSGITTLTATTITATNLGGTLTTPAQMGITSVGTLTSLTLAGAVSGVTTLTANTLVASHPTLDTYLQLDGAVTSKQRYVQYLQNGTAKTSHGINTTKWFLYDSGAGTDVFKYDLGTPANVYFPGLSTNGTVSTSGTTGKLIVSSDRRMKQDEVLVTDGIKTITQLQPKRFKWKTTPDKTEIGFIAQDVELIIPEAVDGKQFEYEFKRKLPTQQGESGDVMLDNTGAPMMDMNRPRYRGLNQNAILAVAVKAIQELNDKVKILDSQLQTVYSTLKLKK